MELQETDDNRARLYIPAKLRDSLHLTNYEHVAISLDCDDSQIVAHIEPVQNDRDHSGIVRPLTVKSNRQVQVNFPRQVAIAAGFLSSELALEKDDDHLTLRLNEQ